MLFSTKVGSWYIPIYSSHSILVSKLNKLYLDTFNLSVKKGELVKFWENRQFLLGNPVAYKKL